MGITTEELKALFPEAELSEDTVLKIKIMVENAIKEKVDAALVESAATFEAEKAELQSQIQAVQEQAAAYEQYAATEIESIKAKAQEYSEYVVQEMTEKVDAYAEYVVEKFIEDNRQALVEGQEYSRMKSVFESIKSAFEGAEYELVQVDKSSEHDAALQEAKSSYNSLYDKYQAVLKENEEMQYAMVFESLTKDLADTQKEKIKALIEHVSFVDVAEFKRGVELMIGQISEGASTATEESDASVQSAASVEEVEASAVVESKAEEKPASPMSRYLNVL